MEERSSVSDLSVLNIESEFCKSLTIMQFGRTRHSSVKDFFVNIKGFPDRQDCIFAV